MSVFIQTSNATDPIGLPGGRKLLRVASGAFADRMALLTQNDSGAVELRWADSPFTLWSAPLTVAADSADSPFDCWMNATGDIFLVYTATTTFDLLLRKLPFKDGAWSADTPLTINSVDDCYFPSIDLEPSNRLWVSYTRVTAGSYYINAIKSDDWGVTWTVGAGETLTGPGTAAYSQVVVTPALVFVIYTLSGTKLAAREKPFLASNFNPETALASGTSLNERVHVAVSSDGRLGVLFDNGALNYKEHDGAQWLSTAIVDSAGATSPRLSFSGNDPLALYTQISDSGQLRTLYSIRKSGSFSVGVDLDPAKTALDKVTLFESGSGAYEDRTAEAASTTAADLFHSVSGTLVKSVNDATYFGMSERFHYLKLLLATAGTGGVISWQYWDGSAWVGFTPAGGINNLTTGESQFLLWNDLDSAPGDWQKTAVNGVTNYWLRALVTTSFTTAPVGTQITARPETLAFITEVR